MNAVVPLPSGQKSLACIPTPQPLQEHVRLKDTGPCNYLAAHYRGRWLPSACLVVRRKVSSGLRVQPLSQRYWACLGLVQLKHSAHTGRFLPAMAPGFMHISPKWISPSSDSSSLMKSLLPRLTPPEEMTTSACDSTCIFCRHKCEPLASCDSASKTRCHSGCTKNTALLSLSIPVRQ